MIVMQNTYSLGIFKWRLNALTFAKLSPAFTFILKVLIQRHTYNYSSINVHNCTIQRVAEIFATSWCMEVTAN